MKDATSKEFWDAESKTNATNLSIDGSDATNSELKRTETSESDTPNSSDEESACNSEFSKSEELGVHEKDSSGDSCVIIDMPDHTNCEKGGTMRLGLRKTIFRPELKETSVLCEDQFQCVLIIVFSLSS